MGFLSTLTGGDIASGVGSIAQIGLGVYDRIKSNKEYKKAQSFFEKNKYDIPESMKASLINAEQMASGVTLPTEDILRGRLANTTSNAVGSAQTAATSAGDVLSVLKDVYGNQMQGEQDVVLAGQQRYDQNQAMLRGELNNMAGYEDQKWQYNVLYPYQQMLGRAGAFSERGASEISGGFTGLGQTAANYNTVQSQQQWYDDMVNRRFGDPNAVQRTPMPQMNSNMPQMNVDRYRYGGGFTPLNPTYVPDYENPNYKETWR